MAKDPIRQQCDKRYTGHERTDVNNTKNVNERASEEQMVIAGTGSSRSEKQQEQGEEKAGPKMCVLIRHYHRVYID
jgi:hypothetical protein